MVGALPGPQIPVRALVRRRLGRAGRPAARCRSWAGPSRSAWTTSSSTRRCGTRSTPGTPAPVLRYFDHVLPLRDGIADLPLGVLLAQQHYRLADWHDAATQLNWRRFFDIDSLIAIRVEDPDVFHATHQVLLRLVAEGLIDGLRVDHPDGLADPAGYLRRLASATGDAWVVVEKILARGEQLPDWSCAGTTGYDAAQPGQRPVRGPGRGRAADRRIRPLHRRPGQLRRGGAGRQAVHRRRHFRRRAGPAHPAVRPRGLPGPGRRQPRGPARRPGRAAGRVRRVPGLRDPRPAAARRRDGRGVGGRLRRARTTWTSTCTRLWTRSAPPCSAWAARPRTRRSRPRATS